MPGPIRKPLAHPAHAQMITSRAIELFEQMQRCRCTCDPDDRDHRFEGPGCKRREALDEAIGVECKTPIWQYPCIENPRAENPTRPATQTTRGGRRATPRRGSSGWRLSRLSG